MKRSEINQYIREFRATLDAAHFYLPPFCSIPASEWKDLGHEYDEIRNRMLGWDITDFGSGDFKNTGLQLVTIRNGNPEDPQSKTYAEKIMLVREKQVTPLHFHWFKMEDIINKGGGNLLIRVYNSLPNEEMDMESDVTVHTDGRTYQVKAGTQIRLTPGESISIQPLMYHDFEVEKGTGAVLLGEVSQVNDDNTDNRFNPPVGRFPEIEEDEAPYRFLCNEYPKATQAF